MLTRVLYLSAIWFALSLLATLLIGSRFRRGHLFFSIVWLIAIIVLGDLWALLTFGILTEVVVISAVAFVFGLAWIFWLRDWNALGQVTWSMTFLTTILFIIYAFALTAFSPLNPLSFMLALTFFFVEMITLVLALAHLYESLDSVCRIRWRRLRYELEPIPGYQPMVSLHVPAYNEPVEVVKETLYSLARLDYPNFEVLVVDNNTPAEDTWRPLEKICHELGPHFHCLHLDQWPGYKSGALNFALAQTHPQAQIIGIIDADYQVEPNFLRELVPAFYHPEVAFIQTPQDYSDHNGSAFSESTYHGYKYFFEVSMPSRNEYNAIIFAGTMGLLRRSVLEEIGGWDEWCITEDAEASLRILKRGYQSLYIKKTFGRGLMPFTFEGLKKQRFRWCFGGIQILKKHWEALMPWAQWVDPANKLTMAQRYFYLVGGIGWFTDVFNLVFAFFLTLGAIFSLLSGPLQVRPLTTTMIVVPAVFLFLHLWRFLWVLRNRLKLSFSMALATMYNFFSLGWAVTLACIQGIVQREGVFLRTPKATSSSRAWQALRVTQWESVIGLICLSAGLVAFIAHPNWRTVALFALLAWQGSLYLAAPVFSLLSVGAEAVRPVGHKVTDQGKPVLEYRAARWAAGLALASLVAVALIGFLPTPGGAPMYTRFLPIEVSPGQLFGFDRLPLSQRIVAPTLTATNTPTTTPTPTLELEPPPPLPTLGPTATSEPIQSPVPTDIPGDVPTEVPTAGSTDTPAPPTSYP